MKTVVHISGDFPDPFAPNKTAAVANLVDGAPGFRHFVYSLNRVDGIFGVTGFPFGVDHICLIYRAPPKGLLLGKRTDDLAEWIIADLKSRGIKPDVIHAHKFTIEGLIARRIRDALGCHVICNIQGATDTYIAERRFDMRSTYRRLAADSEKILSFAPWSGMAMQRILGVPLHYEVLPVGTECDRLLTPVMSEAPRLVSLFHLDRWRAKGADTLAAAVALVAKSRPDISLDIYGSGSEKERRLLQAAISRCGAYGLVHLRGPLPRDRVQQTLNGYSAFAMPSPHETYGMAFVEALFSGTPVVFPRGQAIDGILPESDVGSGCEASNVHDLAHAIRHVLDNEVSLKNRLRKAQSAGDLDYLRLTSITARYRTILEEVTS